MDLQTWQTFAIIISLVALVIGILATRNKNLYTDQHDGGIGILLIRITDLEKRVEERDQRIKELKNDMDALKSERDHMTETMQHTITTMQERIAFLESLLYNVTKNAKPSDMSDQDFQATPKTLLITSNEQIQKSDEIALNKARISYRRVVGATLQKIDDEFRRRRSEDKMYRFIVFSMHMSDAGIELADGTVLDSYWLNTNLDGEVKVVILNGCSSTKTADDLVGVVDYVISITESINNNDAATFLTVFWRRFKHGDTVLGAFTLGKQAVPNAASFIDIQYHVDLHLTIKELED